MIGLLAGVGRVKSREELTEQFAELLLPVGGQMRSDGWRVVRRSCRRLYARGEQCVGGYQTWIGSIGAGDLPAVWSAATTTLADRQRVARLLLEKVVVTVDRASERVDVVLHWVGGATREDTMTRPVVRSGQQSD